MTRTNDGVPAVLAAIEAAGQADPDAAKKVAEAAKAAADAEAARIAAERAQAELAEWRDSADLRKAQNEAAQAKIAEEAEKAERDKWAALVPDLSKVQLGQTSAAGDQAIRGSALALRALEDAAGAVAKVVTDLKPTKSVLVTGEVDLAAGEAAHRSVRTGLARLTKTADDLLERVRPPAQEVAAPLAVGAIVAQAVPALMSLASPKRNVTTVAVPADDLASAASVIGKLLAAGVPVVHDDFRMPKATRLENSLADLIDKRNEVADRAEQLGDDRKADRDQLKSFVASVDALLTAISTVPSGASRSPWADACLRDALHDESVEYVVLVKGAAGTTTQLVSDRPFAADDVSLVADVSITYLVLHVADNRLVAAGSAAGTATVIGKIGAELDVKP